MRGYIGITRGCFWSYDLRYLPLRLGQTQNKSQGYIISEVRDVSPLIQTIRGDGIDLRLFSLIVGFLITIAFFGFYHNRFSVLEIKQVR